MTYETPDGGSPSKKKKIDPAAPIEVSQSGLSGLPAGEDPDKVYQVIGNALQEYDQWKKSKPGRELSKLFERYVNSLKRRNP